MEVLAPPRRTLKWDPQDEVQVEEARKAFDLEMFQGMGLAYVVTGEKSGTAIREFDPSADEIMVTPRLVGG